MTAMLIVAALVATFLSALVSGFENGVYALSHIRLRYRVAAGDPRAILVQKMLSHPQRLLSGLLLANNIILYVTTAVVTSIVEGYVVWAEAVSTLLLAVFFFIAAEAVPKTVFRRASDTLIYALARPMQWALFLLRPAEMALRAITWLIRRVGRGQADAFDPLFTRERLAYYMREGRSAGVLSDYQVELTQNILRGERATVGRAMIALSKTASVPVETTLEEFAPLARRHRYSRYPVWRGEPSNVVGILNIYDCLLPEAAGLAISQLMRPATFFASAAHVTEALRSMRETRQPMGIVADKGRAVGIVTVKDCMEEIVGELYAW